MSHKVRSLRPLRLRLARPKYLPCTRIGWHASVWVEGARARRVAQWLLVLVLVVGRAEADPGRREGQVLGLRSVVADGTKGWQGAPAEAG